MRGPVTRAFQLGAFAPPKISSQLLKMESRLRLLEPTPLASDELPDQASLAPKMRKSPLKTILAGAAVLIGGIYLGAM